MRSNELPSWRNYSEQRATLQLRFPITHHVGLFFTVTIHLLVSYPSVPPRCRKLIPRGHSQRGGGSVLVSYPSVPPRGPHRPTGPLQYRPIGIRPDRPEGQSAPVCNTSCFSSIRVQWNEKKYKLIFFIEWINVHFLLKSLKNHSIWLICCSYFYRGCFLEAFCLVHELSYWHSQAPLHNTYNNIYHSMMGTLTVARTL